MGTLQIFSKKADDLIFLNEMARRMNLKTEMKIPDLGQEKEITDYEETTEEVVEGLKRALIELEEAQAGKRNLKTLEDLLDENRD